MSCSGSLLATMLTKLTGTNCLGATAGQCQTECPCHSFIGGTRTLSFVSLPEGQNSGAHWPAHFQKEFHQNRLPRTATSLGCYPKRIQNTSISRDRIQYQNLSLSLLTLFSFHCLLRPAEARQLRWCDVKIFDGSLSQNIR